MFLFLNLFFVVGFIRKAVIFLLKPLDLGSFSFLLLDHSSEVVCIVFVALASALLAFMRETAKSGGIAVEEFGSRRK
jgi:hypothetical protein